MSQVVVRDISLNATVVQTVESASTKKTRIGCDLFRSCLTSSLYLIGQRQQRIVIRRVLGDSAGNDKVVVADSDVRRISQHPALTAAQEPAIRIGPADFVASSSRQRLQTFPHPFHLTF